MRPLKITVAVLFTVMIIATLTFVSIKQIVNYGVNSIISPHNAHLTCVDFNVTRSLEIVVNKLCIDSEQVNIVLENIKISWFFSSTIKVNSLQIEQATIHLKSKKAVGVSSSNQEINLNNLEAYLSTLSQFELPFPIEINRFHYHTSPKIDANNSLAFTGKITANKQVYHIYLKNSQRQGILSAQFLTKAKELTAKFTADLLILRPLLSAHHLTIPAPANLEKTTRVEGTLTSKIVTEKNKLMLDSKLTDLKIHIPNSYSQSDALTLQGMVLWKTAISNNQIQFNLAPQSYLQTNFKKNDLLNLLKKNGVSTDVLAVIQENLPSTIRLKSYGIIVLDPQKKQISLNTVKLTSDNKTPITLMLSNIGLTYKTEQENNISLNKGNFALNATLNLKSLPHINTPAVEINAKGQIKSHNVGWQITFAPTTNFKIPQLTITDIYKSPPQNKHEKNTINQRALGINALKLSCRGNIIFNKNKLTRMALLFNSQARQITLPELVSAQQLTLAANVSGNFDKMMTTALLSVNKQPLANIKLTGPVNKIHVDISAKNIPLAELFTLRTDSPFKVSLTDGSINYQLIGQITDTRNWLNNNAQLSVSIKDLAGVIQQTSLQGVNWQQQFFLKNNEITTKNNQYNLSIGQIETNPALSNFSAKSNISYQDNNLNITTTDASVNTLGGTIKFSQILSPFTSNHSANVQLDNIDLEKLLELEPQRGIVVTGKVSGIFPVFFDGKQYTIENGQLYNTSTGIIQVVDSPKIEQLKAGDPKLTLAFEALQNIHYHQLTSDVSMTRNGYMLLDTAIKGVNPDIDNDVNLNLKINYDLFGLFESLNMSKHLEQTLVEGLQNN